MKLLLLQMAKITLLKMPDYITEKKIKLYQHHLTYAKEKLNSLHLFYIMLFSDKKLRSNGRVGISFES